MQAWKGEGEIEEEVLCATKIIICNIIDMKSRGSVTNITNTHKPPKTTPKQLVLTELYNYFMFVQPRNFLNRNFADHTYSKSRPSLAMVDINSPKKQ